MNDSVNMRAIDRKTNKAFPANTATLDELMNDIEEIKLTFLYEVMDATTIESLNLTLLLLADRYELRNYPIAYKKEMRFIWGFRPVSVNPTDGSITINFRYHRS